MATFVGTDATDKMLFLHFVKQFFDSGVPYAKHYLQFSNGYFVVGADCFYYFTDINRPLFWPLFWPLLAGFLATFRLHTWRIIFYRLDIQFDIVGKMLNVQLCHAIEKNTKIFFLPCVGQRLDIGNLVTFQHLDRQYTVFPLPLFILPKFWYDFCFLLCFNFLPIGVYYVSVYNHHCQLPFSQI